MKQKKKLRKDRKNILLVLSLILLVITFVFFGFILINSFKTLEKKEIFSYIIVSDHYGFDLNSSTIAFGMVAPGGSATRKIGLENKYPFPIKVEIIPGQDMKKFLGKKEYVILSNKTQKITMSAYAPPETPYGNYSGNISIVIKRYIW